MPGPHEELPGTQSCVQTLPLLQYCPAGHCVSAVQVGVLGGRLVDTSPAPLVHAAGVNAPAANAMTAAAARAQVFLEVF